MARPRPATACICGRARWAPTRGWTGTALAAHKWREHDEWARGNYGRSLSRPKPGVPSVLGKITRNVVVPLSNDSCRVNIRLTHPKKSTVEHRVIIALGV